MPGQTIEYATTVGSLGGLGTGVATALAANVGSAGAPVTFNGALGTPSSGTLTNATGLPVAGLHANVLRKVDRFDEFMDFVNGVTGGSVSSSVSGTSAANSANSIVVSGRPGVNQSTTGTDTTGRAGYLSSSGMHVFANGVHSYETDIRIPILSTVGEEFILRIGFIDTVSADSTDGAYLIYDRLTSVNWIMGTAQGGTRTATASALEVAAAAWLRLKVVVNAAGTSVEYFVDGVSIGTVATNIPGAGQNIGFGAFIIKSAGTTARTMETDWYRALISLTASR